MGGVFQEGVVSLKKVSRRGYVTQEGGVPFHVCRQERVVPDWLCLVTTVHQYTIILLVNFVLVRGM